MITHHAPDAYDPPVALEGENKGLVEAMAARLWYFRSIRCGAGAKVARRVGIDGFERTTVAVKTAWRECARDALGMLFAMGFTGPGGPPRDPVTGWSYAWLDDTASWEIMDDAGGLVALVGYEADLNMIMAAPKMAGAIRALLEAVEGTAAAEAPEIAALRDALPPPETKVRTQERAA